MLVSQLAAIPCTEDYAFLSSLTSRKIWIRKAIGRRQVNSLPAVNKQVIKTDKG